MTDLFPRIKRKRSKPRPGRLRGKALEQLRRDCFDRDMYRCQECNRPVTWETGQLAHIRAKRIGLDVIGNVRCLCFFCHAAEHQFGKSGVKPVPAKERRA